MPPPASSGFFAHMADTFYAGAYWPPRHETLQECAQRAETFFRLLSSCDPVFARWCEKASSRKKALQLQFEPTFDTFLRLFAKKKYQCLDGFLFGAWTGHEESARNGSVTLLCGSGKASSNNCLVRFPSQEPEARRVLTEPVLRQVLHAQVVAWAPSWCGAVSNNYLAMKKQPIGAPYTSWLLYVSHSRGEVPPLPAPVRTEPLEDRGTLITLTPDRFDTTNPSHVALAEDVRERLARAGLLGSILPPAS